MRSARHDVRRPLPGGLFNGYKRPEGVALYDLLPGGKLLMKAVPLEDLIAMANCMSRMHQIVAGVDDTFHRRWILKQALHLFKNRPCVREDAVLHIGKAGGS